MLLGFGAPCQLPLLAGREHGRIIPLPDVRELVGGKNVYYVNYFTVGWAVLC